MSNLVDIKRFLVDSNPHWAIGRTELPSSLNILYRPQFDLLLEKIEKPQILGLLGIRRVGKSVMMRQLAHHLNRDVPAQNICHISFDEELVSRNPDILDQLIQMQLAMAQGRGKIFFFIDEIQFVKNWQHILKRYYDRELDVKFIISGSSSLFLRKRTTESLVGRIFEFNLTPLSFWEYILLGNQNADAAKRLSQIKINFDGDDFSGALKELEDIYLKNPFLAGKFDEYLYCRQFPEAVLWSEEEACEYIRTSVYKKTLLYDIPRLFQIRQPDELMFLYNILMRESANIIEINNLARDAGINRNTVSSYLEYLRDSLLHIQLTNATSSIREQRRLLKKGYVPSPNFSATLLKLAYTHPLWPKESGHFAETFVANILWNRYEESLHFYRKKDDEVDFLINPVPGVPQGSSLVEVKYSDDVGVRDLKTILNLAEKFRARAVFCITKNKMGIEGSHGRKIIFLPIWALS